MENGMRKRSSVGLFAVIAFVAVVGWGGTNGPDERLLACADIGDTADRVLKLRTFTLGEF